MSFVDEEDVITKGFLKPSNLKDGVAYRLKVVMYKHEQGGKFPDVKTGYSTLYGFEPVSENTKEFASNLDGTITMNCNSKRLRTAFFAAGVEIGDTFDLVKTGKGFETNYKVNKIDEIKLNKNE